MKLKYYYFVLLSFALTLVACDDDPVLLKDPVSALSNDCIKRSLLYTSIFFTKAICFNGCML